MATLVVGAAWIVITGLIARSQLNDVRAELPKLRQAVLDGRLRDARQLADRIGTQAHRAHALTTGPAWWVTSNLPGLGSPLRTTRVLSAAADQLGSDVLPTVVRLADELERTHTSNATVDLGPLQRLAPTLHRAATVVSQVTARVSHSDGSWFGPVSSARASVVHQLTRVDGELTGADRAVRLVVPMLGATRPQRYFIGFLNEAEARGMGGIPGAYAIAVADRGHVRFEHFGSDTEFRGVRARVRLGGDFQQLYGQDDPAGTFPNSDLSPDFRNAARIWAGLWDAKTGERVDGAIAVDPTALSYLLTVTGPAHTTSGEQISASNVVALAQRDQYSRFGTTHHGDNAARRAFLVGLAKAISAKLTHGGNPRQLVRAVSRAAAERRFTVWSAQSALEEDLQTARWAGTLGAPADTPYAGFTVNNAAGGKLDYYLRRRFTYARSSCSAGRATATFTVTNGAPSGGLPPYVTIRADAAPPGARPGDDRLLVTYFGTAGGRIASVSVDGRPLNGTRASENGLPVAVIDLELPRGASRTITVQVDEPTARSRVALLRQPLVRPVDVSVRMPACSG